MSLGRTTDTLETLFRTLETKLLHLELWCVTFLQQPGNTIRTKESRIKNSRKRIFRLHISKKVQFVIICEIEKKKHPTILILAIKVIIIGSICFLLHYFSLFKALCVIYHKWRHMLKWSLKYISCFSTIFHSV